MNKNIILTDRQTDRIFLAVNVVLLAIGAVIRQNRYSVGIVLLVWLGLIFYGVKVRQNAGVALTMENTKALRGISAIEIMLGHIGIATHNVVQFPNRKAGILFVGIFFMLSGYGLAYGVANKEGYLRGFWMKRVPTVVVPAAIVIAIDAIWHKGIGLEGVLEGGNRWYITELIVLYLVFYIGYRLAKNNGWIVVLLMSVVIVIGAFYVGVDNPWYGSTLCFPLGIIYFEHKEWTNGLKAATRWGAVGGLFVIMAVSMLGFFVYENTFFGNVIARNVASVSFCMIVILMLEVVSIGNTYSEILSVISYEVFLVHGYVIGSMKEIGLTDYVFTVGVITVSVVLSVVLKKIDSMMLVRKNNHQY